MADWIQNVDKEMEKKGTVGAFTKQATDAGMSVQDFAKKVKDNPTDFSERTRERAQFALNMQQIANKKKMAKGGEVEGGAFDLSLRDKSAMYKYLDKGDFTEEKFMKMFGKNEPQTADIIYHWAESRGLNTPQSKRLHKASMKQMGYAKGGKTQGYNDKLNEDLGTRLGRESNYTQTLKDRRDESKAANKNLGRRAYSSVDTMDKGDRMFMEGGKTQGYDDRDRESIGERNRGKKSQSLDSRMRESAGMEKSMGRRKYADVSTMDKGKRKMAKGGYVYRESDDEDATEYLTKSEAMEFINEHNEGFETNYKSIEDFNKGEQLANGVRSIEKIKMARGGSVEGKIDRDRYVKLRREKDKEIAKLKKEKGALRKATITKDKCDDKIEKVEAKKVDNTEDNNNQTLLVGGIAGILLGAFFIGR
jgi:hypothetical protein